MRETIKNLKQCSKLVKLIIIEQLDHLFDDQDINMPLIKLVISHHVEYLFIVLYHQDEYPYSFYEL